MFGRRLLWTMALFLCLAGTLRAEKPKKLLLLGQGPDGHPPTTHEYVAGLQVLAKCLKPVAGLEIIFARADEPWKEGPELLDHADGVVLFLSEGAKWMRHDPKREQALAKLAERGGAVTVLHWAMGTKDAKNIDFCKRLAGGCHGGPDRKYKDLETDVTVADPKHPVTAGIKDFRVRDEFYYQLKLAPAPFQVYPLLRAAIDGKPETVAWACERPDGGRSFGFSGLHYHDNWRLPEYRRLAAQGVLWTLRLPTPAKGLAVEVSADDLKLR